MPRSSGSFRMSGPRNLVVIADPELPVPPAHYGGIERVIALLVDGLSARGHNVTLFANPQSQVACPLIPLKGTSTSKLATMRNAAAIASFVTRNRTTLVHSFGRLAYLTPILPL